MYIHIHHVDAAVPTFEEDADLKAASGRSRTTVAGDGLLISAVAAVLLFQVVTT